MSNPDETLTPEPQMLPHDPNDPFAVLRADLDVARAEIRRLQERMTVLEDRHASDMRFQEDRITRRKTEIAAARKTAHDALTVASNAIEIVKRKS